MRRHLDLLMIGIVVMSVATGLNNLVPGIGYALILFSAAILVFNSKFIATPLRFVDLRMIAGYLVFNSFFLFHSMFFSLEPRVYFIDMIALAVFVLAYACARMALHGRNSPQYDADELRISIIILCALSVLLLGQFAEILGYVDPRDLDLNRGAPALLFRPGGFLNPNTTAAIALAYLFASVSLNSPKTGHMVTAIALTSVIIVLAQSRTAIVVLLYFLVHLLLLKKLSSILAFGGVFLLVSGFLALVYQDEVDGLVDATIARFGVDNSFDERIFVLKFGLSEFTKAPLLGHGYRYLTDLVGLSAHNEIVENLVNFGVVGFAVVAVASYLLYMPASILFLIVCVAPTFVFSHNFYETTAFQAALGVALAIDRLTNRVPTGS